MITLTRGRRSQSRCQPAAERRQSPPVQPRRVCARILCLARIPFNLCRCAV